MSFSDRWVFYASHDWPNSNVCVTVGCRLVKINNERAVRIGSLLLNKKYVLKEFLRRQNVFVNLPNGFPVSCNRCRCIAAYSLI